MSAAGVVIAQANPVVSVSPPLVVKSVSATRGLGIAQIVIGTLSIIFGIVTIAVLSSWYRNVGFGIWGGIWILVGGILGVSSAGSPSNGCLNGTNMAFAIISCVISFIQFIIYCFAAAHYNTLKYCYYIGYPYYHVNCYNRSNSTGVALYIIFLLLMLLEFCIALTAAIYCCKDSCCSTQTGTVIQQSQPTVMFSTGMSTLPYPAASGVQVSYATPVAYSTQPMMYPNQTTYVSTAGYGHFQAPNATTYNPSTQTYVPASGYGQNPAPPVMTYDASKPASVPPPAYER